MNVIRVMTGELAENTYIVYEDGTEEALLIDPGDDADEIISAVTAAGLSPAMILLTHGHHDHIGAAEALRARYGIPVAIHEKDADMLTDACRNLSVFFAKKTEMEPADVLLKDGDEIERAGLLVKVLHTPGHSAGGVCYLLDNEIFAGDTLFMQSIGRTDFPDSSPCDMQHSLEKLCALKGDYTVYPGHGPATTLNEERKYNPYMGRD